MDLRYLTSCTALTSVGLPAATSIGDSAFYWCRALESVSLPAATSIGDSAFIGCYALESVSLPASLTTINGNPFAYCPNLTSIAVDPANTAFTFRDGMLMNKAETALIGYLSATGDVTLPTITTVANNAFAGTALTSVSLPAATSIGDSAFDSCRALTSVSLPAVTAIGYMAFQNCYALESVSLPSATSIGAQAFYYCTSLTSVSLPATPLPIRTGTGLAYSIFSSTGSTGTITVSIPAGAVSAYTSVWRVDASTPASGNTSAYGENHKAVLITDAAQ